MPQEITRIIDVNLNRASEGLRVLEELARFVLNSAALTERLKAVRHGLVLGDLAFNRGLLEARDAEGDVGADITVSGQEEAKDLAVLAVANARRVQEALRVLEEVAKLKDSPVELSSDKFMKARFSLYTIERELVARLLRQDKLSLINGLYVVIDTQSLKGRTHMEVGRAVIKGGAKVIQLRDKLTGKKELFPIALELRKVCAENGALFIVNDHLDLALATDADGLHVGQTDLPFKEARWLLPMDKILGCSVKNAAEARLAEADGVDYLGCGAIYATSSKDDADVISLAGLSLIKRATSLPVVAIGGISLDNAADVIAAGADSIAVISAILGADSPEKATREMIARLRQGK